MDIFYYAQVDLSGESGSIGSVRHVIEIVNRLSERGHSVTVFVPEPNGEMDQINAEKVITFSGRPGYLGFFAGILECIYLMLKESYKKKPDIFYAREMLYTFHTSLISKILCIPHIIEINGFQPEELRTDETFNPYLFPLLIFMEALNYWLSDRLIAVSEKTREKVIEYYAIQPGKIKMIRNGVNTDRCRPKDTKTSREEVGVKTDPFWIGFLGYLFPWSGVDYMIRAAPQILDKYTSTKFMIIGSGTWGNHLPDLARQEGVAGKFLFTGEIPWEQVPTYLNCLDIGVSPYTTERDTLDSLKTYEYMACGLPVVTADIPEVNRIITENYAGLTFEPENALDLARKIIKLIENDDMRKKMSMNARHIVVEKYDWARTVDETQKLFEDISVELY